MEMDEMELDRYITGMLDTEHRNMKKDVRAKKKPKSAPDEREGETDEKH